MHYVTENSMMTGAAEHDLPGTLGHQDDLNVFLMPVLSSHEPSFIN
jgi:hypothetical protein